MWTEMSDPAILKKIGSRVQELRIRKNLTQKELSEQAGVSIFTVAKLEKGQSIALALFISILRVLDLLENLDELLPERPVSPNLMKKLRGKVRIRVRK